MLRQGQSAPSGYNGRVKLPRLALVWLLLGWVFAVLYPDPSSLVRSMENIRQVNVDASAVQSLAARLPDNPQLIEQAVLTRLVPYAYDWQVNGCCRVCHRLAPELARKDAKTRPHGPGFSSDAPGLESRRRLHWGGCSRPTEGVAT